MENHVLTTDQISCLLKQNGLADLVAGVKQNGVTGDDLRLLTDEELESELGWTKSQISEVRKAISSADSTSTSKMEEPNKMDGVDFTSQFVPHPSDDFRQQRVFTSGIQHSTPRAVSLEVLNEFDMLTKIIHELEAQRVETKVGRQAAHLKSIEQYIEAHKVVYSKLQKAAEKKGHKLEKVQGGWYPGKLINQCTGKHAEKVEEVQKTFEEMKVQEDAKAKELQVAARDQEEAVSSLNDLQKKVAQLQQCRNQELQLVEDVFNTGTLSDDKEKLLKGHFLQIGPQIHQAREFQRCYGQADELLTSAVRMINEGLAHLQRALSAGRMDQMGNFINPGPDRAIGGNLVLEMAKKRGVATAEELCNHAKDNVIRAKQILPAIPSIDLAEIRQLNFALQLVFDNVVSDAIANRKIQANMQALERFKYQAEMAKRWVEGWLNGRICQDLARLEQDSRDAQAELVNYRRLLLAKELEKK